MFLLDSCLIYLQSCLSIGWVFFSSSAFIGKCNWLYLLESFQQICGWRSVCRVSGETDGDPESISLIHFYRSFYKELHKKKSICRPQCPWIVWFLIHNIPYTQDNVSVLIKRELQTQYLLDRCFSELHVTARSSSGQFDCLFVCLVAVVWNCQSDIKHYCVFKFLSLPHLNDICKVIFFIKYVKRGFSSLFKSWCSDDWPQFYSAVEITSGSC